MLPVILNVQWNLVSQTPVFWKVHRMDVFFTIRYDHLVKLLINLDIQLLEPDTHNYEPNVISKGNFFHLTGHCWLA